MSSERGNILEFNQYMKSQKMPYIIYDDIESLIKKIDGCANNPEKFSTIKIGKYIPCRYQCPEFGHLIIKKTSIFYIAKKIV